jgi:hypothetical protein
MQNCDVLIILDNIQFARRSYGSRTQIKTQAGARWLTLPVAHGPIGQKINEVRLFEPAKNQFQNFKTIRHAYAQAPYFASLAAELEPLYTQPREFLLPFNLQLIQLFADILEIKTPLLLASSLGEPPAGKNERIIFLCQQCGADTYYSGRGGKAYNEPLALQAAGLTLEYQNFQPPVYPQGKGDFIPGLSILDLVMYAGPKQSKSLLLQSS